MQRAASALGVAIIGVIVTRSRAQLTADTDALQTPTALPQYRDADPHTLTGLYLQTQDHIQATADANAFLMDHRLAVLGTLLVLSSRNAPITGSADHHSRRTAHSCQNGPRTAATEPRSATVAAIPHRDDRHRDSLRTDGPKR